MPSVHCAMALWLVLTVHSYARRWTPVAGAYAALIWLGSVHLGWHYVLDGAVGMLGAVAVWHLAPRLAFRWTPRRIAHAAA